MDERENTARGRVDRRELLAGAGAALVGSTAGCSSLPSLFGGGDDDDAFEPGLIGSGREGRGTPGGTPMDAMPDLEGTLNVYSGRSQLLVEALFNYIRDRYPDFTLNPRYDEATDLANRLRAEGSGGNADVFFTVNSGVLGLVAGEGHTRALPDDVVDLVRDGYHDPDGQWVGTSGRVRTVPYNTNALSGDEVPDDISAFPDAEQFQDAMGWAPTYGSFQGFVTAMRVLDGEEAAREWLQGMLDAGVEEYANEFQIAQAVADGELDAGFTNHYYVVRVQDDREDPPIDIALTDGDAGSFFNVAGAAVLDTTDDEDLAANFVRHLLSAEAQDYFARSRTFEYPMIPDVEPIEELPSFDELEPPDLDLAEFATADIGETVDLMEEVGVL